MALGWPGWFPFDCAFVSWWCPGNFPSSNFGDGDFLGSGAGNAGLAKPFGSSHNPVDQRIRWQRICELLNHPACCFWTVEKPMVCHLLQPVRCQKVPGPCMTMHGHALAHFMWRLSPSRFTSGVLAALFSNYCSGLQVGLMLCAWKDACCAHTKA